MGLSSETATPANSRRERDCRAQASDRGREGVLGAAFGIFDKLRVTSLSGMGACQFGITHPAVAERKFHGHNSMSRFQAGEHQASSSS